MIGYRFERLRELLVISNRRDDLEIQSGALDVMREHLETERGGDSISQSSGSLR
jgi:hypothetical protein